MDKFFDYADQLTASGTDAAAVVPNDTTDLATGTPKAIYVGTGGSIAMVGSRSATVTATLFKNVPAGSILPFRPRRILATGTTAADIVAIY